MIGLLTNAINSGVRAGGVRPSVLPLFPHLVDDLFSDRNHHTGSCHVTQPHRQEPRRQHEAKENSTQPKHHLNLLLSPLFFDRRVAEWLALLGMYMYMGHAMYMQKEASSNPQMTEGVNVLRPISR